MSLFISNSIVKTSKYIVGKMETERNQIPGSEVILTVF